MYWKPGNSAAFLDLVEKLTGAPLSADAWVANLKKPLEVKVGANHELVSNASDRWNKMLGPFSLSAREDLQSCIYQEYTCIRGFL